MALTTRIPVKSRPFPKSKAGKPVTPGKAKCKAGPAKAKSGPDAKRQPRNAPMPRGESEFYSSSYSSIAMVPVSFHCFMH